MQSWEKRKYEIIDDGLTARGKLDNELSDLSKEWDHQLKDEYDALFREQFQLGAKKST